MSFDIMPSPGDGVYAASVRCEDHFEGSFLFCFFNLRHI